MFSQVFILKFWKLIEILFQVVDMAIVVEVISQLEKYAITKEALEVILFWILNLLYNEKNHLKYLYWHVKTYSIWIWQLFLV